MDAARPRHDRATIEKALRAYLKGVGPLPKRVVWVEDARSGFRHVADQAHSHRLPSGALISIIYVWYAARSLVLLSVCGGLGAVASSAPLGIFASWLGGDKTGLVLRGHFGPPTVLSVVAVTALVGTFYLALILLFARNMRRRDAIAQPIQAALRRMQPYWDTATLAAAGEDVFVADFWHHVRNSVPFAAHAQAHQEVLGPSVRHITGSQACPMTEAFEAGLFLFWVRPHEVVCVPQPTLHVVDGQLHSDNRI
jgi:hypothetical protein